MKTRTIEMHYEVEQAKKVAELFRRSGRSVQIRPARAYESRSMRRVVVDLKRGEDEYKAEKMLAKKARGLINLSSQTKEQRQENARRAILTRADKKAAKRLEYLSIGLYFEVLRDFALKPRSNRIQRIENAPIRKGVKVRNCCGDYNVSEEADAIYNVSVRVSRNIAIEVAERYYSRDGFYINQTDGYNLVEIGFVVTEKNWTSSYWGDELAKSAEVFISGVYKPAKAG